MKKFLLSFVLILVFTVYAVHQKTQGLDREKEIQSISPQTPASNKAPNPPLIGKNFGDGTYTGDITDAYYGNVQVQITVQSGKITDVKFLDYPHDRSTSVFINTQAVPYLKTEAIQAQSAQVDVVSGATQTSEAFMKSLGSAINKASV